MAKAFVLALVLASTVVGCGAKALPDPRDAVTEYRDAVRRGDVVAVHRLLTEETRRAYGAAGTKRLLDDGRAEILAVAQGAAAKTATVHAVAEVPYDDGERALVDVEGGRYRVSAAAGLPSAARTPSQALADLRAALARRSYGAMMRLLSAETRLAVEHDLRSLVVGLQDLDSLDVKISGETAEVGVPGGHRVVLKREAGVWRVHDFD